MSCRSQRDGYPAGATLGERERLLLDEGRARAPGHSAGKGGGVTGDKKWQITHNLQSLESSLRK